MGLFYQSEIIRLYRSGDTTGVFVPNVQSVSTAMQVQRTDTMRLGKFAPMPMRVPNMDPTPTMNIDFIPTGSDIFRTLGLYGTTSAVDSVISGASSLLDAKIQIREMNNGGGNVGTINLRSGALTNLSLQVAVGQTPKASFTLEFLDMGMDASAAVVPPVVDDGYSVIRPQDIDVTIPTGLFGINSFHPQSLNLTLPLARTPVSRIGQRKAVARHLNSPILATLQVQAIVDSFSSTNGVSGNSTDMYRLTCGRYLDNPVVINIKQPECSGPSSVSLLRISGRNPYLESINYSNSVGGFTSVEVNFTIPVTFENNATESNLVFL